MDLNFTSAFISSTFDQVLAETTVFPIKLTKIINQTDPLSNDGSAIFSGIWSYSFSVNSDELFINETRYTFFYRTQTSITVTIEQNIFYINNLQQPIARQTEIIFRSLLFTIVVLEVFGLLFLLVKLLIIPVFRTMYSRLHRKKQVNPTNDLAIVGMKNSDSSKVTPDIFDNKKSRCRSARTNSIKQVVEE